MSPKRSIRALAGLATAAIVVLAPSTYAFAAKGSGGTHKTPSSAGTCWSSPGAVAVGSDYSLSASGLPANTLVSVYVTDPMGTQWTNGTTDASGSVSVAEHASYSGSYTAKVTSGAMTAPALASCTFSAS